MRTTIEIADDLLRRAKQKAADRGIPLRSVVEAALRDYLSGKPTTSGYKLVWRTEKGELLPGVDIDDRDSVWDIMDSRK